jgi:acetyltransferase-like isoleucine patch superfamily enzyme
MRKPLIFVGSSSNMARFADLCRINGIEVAGIIDNDYYGNTKEMCGMPIIDTEQSFHDDDKLKYYRDNFDFFCATTWMPETNQVAVRNKSKRDMLIDLMDEKNLSVISLIDPFSRIASDAIIGKGVFIDAFTIVESECRIDDYVCVYAQTGVGHHTRLMRNCVIQRYCSISGDCVFEPNTYLGTAVKALKPGAIFGTGTFIHEAVYIRRGTVPNEIVGMNGKNMSRVTIL